jgi:hypothetical protein
MFCWSKMISTLQASSVWIVLSRSISDRPTRSIAQAITTLLRIVQHSIEAGSIAPSFCSAYANIGIGFDDRPAASLGNGRERLDLVLHGLFIRADSDVESRAFRRFCQHGFFLRIDCGAGHALDGRHVLDPRRTPLSGSSKHLRNARASRRSGVGAQLRKVRLIPPLRHACVFKARIVEAELKPIAVDAIHCHFRCSLLLKKVGTS